MTTTDEHSDVPLFALTPPVLKPSGAPFEFWRQETTYTKTYHVDAGSPRASDDNPGTAAAPLKTIGRAAQLLNPGECVIVHAGVYRECVRPARGGTSPARMIGYYAEGEVIVKGSELVGPNWQVEDAAAGIYALDLSTVDFGDYNPFALENLPDASFDIMEWAHPVRGDLPYPLPRGMVFEQGERLERVASQDELSATRGAFFTDRRANRLLVRTRGGNNPNGVSMEITTRRACFRPRVRGLGFIHVRGFTFEQVANCFPRPQEGALSVAAGHHWLIEHNTVRQVNGIGIDIGHGWYGGAVEPPEEGDNEPGWADGGWNIVRANVVCETGVCGIAGIPARNTLIEDNLLWNNTLYPIERIYECAAIKTHANVGTLIRRNLISNNTINGIWMDWDNRDSRCTQNVILDSEQGIFIEASVIGPYCMFDRNVIWGTKLAILEHDSKNQSFVHNFIARAKIGLALRGRMTDRTVASHPTTGGGHTAANNVFFECGETILDSRKPEYEPSVLSGNASEKDGVEAGLDVTAHKLNLRAAKVLSAFCESVRVTHDFVGAPWPDGVKSPGPIPIPDGESVTIELGRAFEDAFGPPGPRIWQSGGRS